jgi:hypothetical protein
MYIKIVHEPSGDESVYECQRYFKHVNRTAEDGPFMRLEMENEHEDSISLLFDSSVTLEIYVMNQEGKTIERINWQPIRESNKAD